MNDSSEEITALVGREVYSKNGVYVGEIEDIQIDLDRELVTGLALHEVNTDLLGTEIDAAHGVMIPYRWVRAVGDVVLVSDLIERIGNEEAEGEVTA